MVVFSAGDTAWILICSLLVLLMSIPAVAFFYGGLSKRKNVLNTIFLTFIAFSIVSVIWVVFGYQFAFGSDVSGLAGEVIGTDALDEGGLYVEFRSTLG